MNWQLVRHFVAVNDLTGEWDGAPGAAHLKLGARCPAEASRGRKRLNSALKRRSLTVESGAMSGTVSVCACHASINRDPTDSRRRDSADVDGPTSELSPTASWYSGICNLGPVWPPLATISELTQHPEFSGCWSLLPMSQVTGRQSLFQLRIDARRDIGLKPAGPGRAVMRVCSWDHVGGSDPHRPILLAGDVRGREPSRQCEP